MTKIAIVYFSHQAYLTQRGFYIFLCLRIELEVENNTRLATGTNTQKHCTTISKRRKQGLAKRADESGSDHF